MAKKKYHCGIIGCGRVIDVHHMPAYNEMEEIEVVALCDKDIEIAKTKAQKYGVPNYYSNFHQMFEKEEIDIALICTPPKSHFSIFREVLKYGVNIMVEKPVADNLEEAQEMLRISREYPGKIVVNQQYRYHIEALAAKKAIDSGCIGKPYWAELICHLWYPSAGGPPDGWRARELERLTIFEMGIHLMDLIRYWFRKEPEQVFCQCPTASHYPAKGEGMGIIQLKFPDGAGALVIQDWTSCAQDLNHRVQARIQGEKGGMQMTLGGEGGIRFGSIIPDAIFPEVLIEKQFWAGMNKRIMKEFIDCIEYDRELSTGLMDNINTLKLVFAAYESADNNRVIAV